MNEEMNEKNNEIYEVLNETASDMLNETVREVENQTVEEAIGQPLSQETVKEPRMNSDVVKKVLIALICVVVISASVGFGYFIAKNQTSASPSNGTTVSDTENASGESPTVDSEADNTEDEADTNEENSTTKQNVSVSGSTEKELKEAILGKWTDNANLSGYEFLEDGIVKVTYFNMSSLNLEDIIDGTYTGTYSLDGNRLTISYTIYSKAITKEYTVEIEDNILTLTSEGDKSVYVRKGSEPVVKTDIDSALIGKWSSNLSGYEFKDNGVVSITYIDLSSMGINIPISGKVDGMYSVEDDNLNIKFSIYSAVIEKNYTYSVEGKVLTLTDKETREKGTYIKDEQ